MQEEVEQRTVTLAINTTKMSANVLKSAIAKYLAYRKEQAREGPGKPCGKQSVKQLVGQNQGVSNIEITDKNIKDFERIARKYGVDFALKKDKTGDIPKLRRRFSCPIGRDFHNRPDGSRVLRTARDCFNSPPSVQAPPAFCASARQRWRGSWRGTASPHQAPSGSLPPCGAGRPPYTHWRRGTVRGNGPPPF